MFTLALVSSHFLCTEVVLRTYVNPPQHLLRDYQVSIEESQLLSLGL